MPAAWHFLVRVRWPVLATIGVLLLLSLVLLAPRLLVPSRSVSSLRDVDDPAKRHELQDQRLKLQNDVRATLLQGLAGTAVLLGAYLTFRQLQLNQQGQITERFTRAVDQLGDEQLAIRVGGISALGRIARDSASDHEQVMDTLAAFVREQTAELEEQRRRERIPADNVPRLRADLQVAATVLGQRSESRRRQESRRINLRGVSLARVHLRKAHLADVALSYADFRRGQLTGIHLGGSLLREACFRWAVLEEADFRESFLVGADFCHARLAKANFEGAWLFGANFEHAQFQHANFAGAYCDQAPLITWLRDTLGEGPWTWADLWQTLDTPDGTDLDIIQRLFKSGDRLVDENKLREAMRQIAAFLDRKLDVSKDRHISEVRISESLDVCGLDHRFKDRA